MKYDWSDPEVPRGKLYDNTGTEIALPVYWCDTETGECKYYADRAGRKASSKFLPPLNFIPYEVQP